MGNVEDLNLVKDLLFRGIAIKQNTTVDNVCDFTTYATLRFS